MLNFAIRHQMPGIEKEYLLCSCGYENYIDKVLGYCPRCQASVIKSFSTLSFDKQEFESFLYLDYNFDNDDCCYKFAIDLAYIKGSIKAKFSKKTIAFHKYDVKHYKIIFDATKPREHMVSYIDMNNKKMCSMYEAVQCFKGINISHMSRYNMVVDSKMKNCKYDKGYISNIYDFINTYMYNLSNTLDKLADWAYVPYNEILIKAGFDPNKLSYEINKDGNNPSEILGIKPYMAKYLKQNGETHLRSLITIEKHFEGQAVNYVETFGKLPGGMETASIRRLGELVKKGNLSIKKLYKYLYLEAPMRQGLYKPKETLNLLYDSYNMCEKLELPFDKNPKALVRYHDILTKEYNLIADKVKAAEFQKVSQNLLYLEYEDKEDENAKYIMTIPYTSQDLIKEGKEMRHCVASYVNRVIDETSIIVFLREKKNPDKSFTTIEIDPLSNKMVQVKMKGNRCLNDKKAIKFLKQWAKIKGIKYYKDLW